MLWREQTDDITDCYFCLTNTQRFPQKLERIFFTEMCLLQSVIGKAIMSQDLVWGRIITSQNSHGTQFKNHCLKMITTVGWMMTSFVAISNTQLFFLTK